MTLAELTADMQARGLITFPLGTVAPPTTLPDNQGTFVRLDVPCIQQMLDNTERKTTQAVHVYNRGNTDPALPAERANYADRIIANEKAPADQPSTLDIGRAMLLQLIETATPLPASSNIAPDLHGQVLNKYTVIGGDTLAGQDAVKCHLWYSTGDGLYMMRLVNSDLTIDPAE